MSVPPTLLSTPRASPSESSPHQAPFQMQDPFPLTPPVSPAHKPEQAAKASRRPSFSFGSPFTFLPGRKSSKTRKTDTGHDTVEVGSGSRSSDDARRKRLPSGQMILIKGPYPHPEYQPFLPPSHILPPLPPMLSMGGSLRAASNTIQQTPTTHSHFRSPSASHPGTINGSFAGSVPPTSLLFSTSLPEDRSFLSGSPQDLSPLSLALSLPYSSNSSPLSSPDHPLTPLDPTFLGRKTGPSSSPPPRPPPPPPHLGLFSLPRPSNLVKRVSKSNPNTPAKETDNPFDLPALSLSAALAARPRTGDKAAAPDVTSKVVTSWGTGRPTSAEVIADERALKVPSMVMRGTEPLKIPMKQNSPARGSGLALPNEDEVQDEKESRHEKDEPKLQSEDLSLDESPAKDGFQKRLTAKERREARLRSIHGLNFPVPPAPFLPMFGSSDINQSNAADLATVPEPPRTPPKLSPLRSPLLPKMPKMKKEDQDEGDSPTHTKRKHRPRSSTISGGARITPTSDVLSAISPNKQAQPLPAVEEQQSPPLGASDAEQARLYAYAHAHAQNQAQLEGVSGAKLGERSISDLEEENRLLRNTLKSQRDRLQFLQQGHRPTSPHSGDAGGSPSSSPSNSPSRPSLKPLRLAGLIGGPPPLPLPPPPQAGGLISSHFNNRLQPVLTASSSMASIVSTNPSNAAEAAALQAQIAALRAQLARARSEIEGYKRFNNTPPMESTASESPNLRKLNIKRSKSDPQLAVFGLGIGGVDDEDTASEYET